MANGVPVRLSEGLAAQVRASAAVLDRSLTEQVEHWVEAHSAKWPTAQQWLQDAWTSDLEDCRGDRHRREVTDEAQQIQGRAERKHTLGSYIAALTSGTAPAHVLHNIAFAYDKRFGGMHGDTPLERIQDYLVTDEAT